MAAAGGLSVITCMDADMSRVIEGSVRMLVPTYFFSKGLRSPSRLGVNSKGRSIGAVYLSMWRNTCRSRTEFARRFHRDRI